MSVETAGKFFIPDNGEGLLAMVFEIDEQHYQKNRKEALAVASALSRRVGLLKRGASESDEQLFRRIDARFHRDDRPNLRSTIEDKLRVKMGDSVLQWLVDAPPEDVRLFATYYAERQRLFQACVETDMDDFIDSTMDREHYLYDIGLFPAGARSLFSDAVNHDNSFTAIDTFEAAMFDVNGYYGGDSIHVANMYDNKRLFSGIGQDMQRTVFHEAMHKSVWESGGFFHGIASDTGSDGLYLHIPEEATVGHASAVSDYAQLAGTSDACMNAMPLVVNPNKRRNGDLTYRALRELFALEISDYGWGALGMDVVTSTYFDRLEDKSHFAKRQHVEKHLAAPYGGREQYFKFAERYMNITNQQGRVEFVESAIRSRVESAQASKISGLGSAIAASYNVTIDYPPR